MTAPPPVLDVPELEIALHPARDTVYPVELRFRHGRNAAEDWLVRRAAFEWSDGPRGEDWEDETLRQQLSAAFFADPELRRALAEAEGAATALGLPLRLRLRASPGAPELHALPWEGLTDPASGRMLATSERLLFSRAVDSTDWSPVFLAPRAELRALVVLADPLNPEKGLKPITVGAELERAARSLERLPFTVLASRGTATLERLIASLREGYDILYLVCHGRYLNDTPVLYLEDEAGRVAKVLGPDFVQRLRDLRQLPALVVLASCQSAASNCALGPALAAAGVPAVLAMHSSFTQETAARFLPAFFRDLQEHGEIDRAVAAARGAGRDRHDAWMPVLFQRLRGGRLWEDQDPRIADWLTRLEALRDGRQITAAELARLLEHAAGEALPPALPRRELLRRLAGRPDIARRLLFTPEVGEAELAGELVGTPEEARRHQILVALRLGLAPRLEKWGLAFLLVPPGRSATGTANAAAFYLAETPVSEKAWADALRGVGREPEVPGTDSGVARTGVSRREMERFVQEVLGGEEGAGFPAPRQLLFALEAGGRPPVRRGGPQDRAEEPRLRSGPPSPLGVHDLTGVVFQLCREGERWSWWGGGCLSPAADFAGGIPSLPSTTTWEEGPDFGFRPILRTAG